MPDPYQATPPPSQAEQFRLAAFLRRRSAAGRSAVIVTSRTVEAWLDDAQGSNVGSLEGSRLNFPRLPVHGLAPEDATQYADELLAGEPAAAANRASPAFAELLGVLEGHPLSMRLVLPHLATTSARELLNSYIGEVPAHEREAEGHRTNSLTASIEYSYRHLSEEARRLLPALALFQGVVSLDLLVRLSAAVPLILVRYSGASSEQWARALDSATAVGLLTTSGPGCFRIHPALPAYLFEQWTGTAYDNPAVERSSSDRALVDAVAGFSVWATREIGSGDTAAAMRQIGLLRPTLNRILNKALDEQLWQQALCIVESLSLFLDAGGLSLEAAGWTDRIRLATETASGDAPPVTSHAGLLWMQVMVGQGNREVSALLLDAAESTFSTVLRHLEAQADGQTTTFFAAIGLASCFHQLGVIAEKRQNYDEADRWLKQSLSIEEQLQQQALHSGRAYSLSGLATSLHELGVVARLRGDLDAAAAYAGRSLRIASEAGDQRARAASLRQLGVVAELRGRLDSAKSYFERSLSMYQQVGDLSHVGVGLHDIGTIAKLLGDYADAKRHFVAAMEVHDRLQQLPELFYDYDGIGHVEELLGRRGEARQWYQKAQELAESVGDAAGAARAKGLLVRLRGGPQS